MISKILGSKMLQMGSEILYISTDVKRRFHMLLSLFAFLARRRETSFFAIVLAESFISG